MGRSLGTLCEILKNRMLPFQRHRKVNKAISRGYSLFSLVFRLNKTVGVNMVGLLETKDEQGTQQLITALAKTLNG